MKISRLIFLAIVVLILLSSCVTYNSYSYSSYTTSGVATKDDPVIVMLDSTNFQWVRVVEQAIVEELEDHGITAYAFSDYVTTINEPTFSSQLNRMMEDTKATFELAGTIQNIYTYEYGGGVSMLEIEFQLIPTSNFAMTIARFSITTESTDNGFDSFQVTREQAVSSMADELVDEYLKYIGY